MRVILLLRRVNSAKILKMVKLKRTYYNMLNILG